MPLLYRLDRRILAFPPVDAALPSGLLAVGGDLSPERLLLGYQSGIFPWYSEGEPILWHSPDPRTVLELGKLHVPKSTEKVLRRRTFEIRFDTDFRGVIEACAQKKRPTQSGTWITAQMIEAYVELHRLGWAHSAEAHLEGRLVGGLYGVAIGRAFFGESMFADVGDASKVAFVSLARALAADGFSWIDCQVHTDHLERFGAEPWPRSCYVRAVGEATGDNARWLPHPELRGRVDAG